MRVDMHRYVAESGTFGEKCLRSGGAVRKWEISRLPGPPEAPGRTIVQADHESDQLASILAMNSRTWAAASPTSVTGKSISSASAT